MPEPKFPLVPAYALRAVAHRAGDAHPEYG
ncbi:hypothetical protein AIGOOFII_1240 [Methylobacterium marchantiae]|nr:hypothetical protein AIGOOFII_1240 [Methylobacterium marchantiae]